MENNEHKLRVLKAMGKYCSRQPCPQCGLPFWNGVYHPFGGVFVKNKDEQLWCNGILPYKGRQGKQDKA